MLTICPTADYEIYLGRNLLPSEQVLFRPTTKLLAVWEEFAIRGTLFPDICSIWRHRELGLMDYAEGCEAQLRDAVARGHDLQLHLHPEWRSAVHESGQWIFRPGTSSLNDLGFDANDPGGAPALIRRGMSYLEDLVSPWIPEYRCTAFRAGGWVIQPEHAILGALRDAGIRADATVIPGVRLLRKDYPVDFRSVPQCNFRLGSSTGLAADSRDPADPVEVPIAAFRGALHPWHHGVNNIRLRRLRARHPEPFRGYPIVKAGPRPGMAVRYANLWKKLSVPRMLDIADTYEAMAATLRSYLSRHDFSRVDLAVCMNGHPKDTYDFHFDECRRFFDHVLSKHATVVRFQALGAWVSAQSGAPQK